MPVSNEIAAPAPDATRQAYDPLSLLDTIEVAALFGMSQIALRAWRLKGLGPAFVKLGRSVKYRRSDLEAFLVSRTASSTSVTLL